MADKQKTILDADNYHKLSEPFDGPEKAEAATDAFWKEFYELRNKHKLPDVHVIIHIPIRYADGETGNVFASMHAGDELKAEPMVAWAFGRVTSERQERVGKMLEQFSAVKAGKNRK